MRIREEKLKKDDRVSGLGKVGMWNLALGTYLFLWLKETVEQRGGCVCVRGGGGRGVGWQGKKAG